VLGVLGSWEKHVYHKSLSEVFDGDTSIFRKPPELPKTGGQLKNFKQQHGVMDKIFKKKQLLLEKKFDITYRYRRMTKKNACNCDAQK
jgi:hypothetical protein